MSDSNLTIIRTQLQIALQIISDAMQMIDKMECDHPEDQRETLPDSTMNNLHWRCQVCGYEHLETGEE